MGCEKWGHWIRVRATEAEGCAPEPWQNLQHPRCDIFCRTPTRFLVGVVIPSAEHGLNFRGTSVALSTICSTAVKRAQHHFLHQDMSSLTHASVSKEIDATFPPELCYTTWINAVLPLQIIDWNGIPFPLHPAGLPSKMVSNGPCIMHLYDYALISWELASDT